MTPPTSSEGRCGFVYHSGRVCGYSQHWYSHVAVQSLIYHPFQSSARGGVPVTGSGSVSKTERTGSNPVSPIADDSPLPLWCLPMVVGT